MNTPPPPRLVPLLTLAFTALIALVACGDDGGTGTPGGTSTNGATSTNNATTSTTNSGSTGTNNATNNANTSNGGSTGTNNASTSMCTDGDRRCGSGQDRVEVCEGGVWVEQVCSDGWACEGGECVPPEQVCEAGMRRCADEGTAETCADDGTRWEAAPCTEGEVCDDGACVPRRVCEDGERRCVEGAPEAFERCEEGGGGFALDACPEGQRCEGDGVCAEAPLCTPGAPVCDAQGQRATCNAEGTGFEDPQSCPDQGVCAEGACLTACEASELGLGPWSGHMGCTFWSAMLEGSPLQIPGMTVTNPHTVPLTLTVYDYIEVPEQARAEAGVQGVFAHTEILDADGALVARIEDGAPLDAVEIPPGGSASVLVARKRVLGVNTDLRVGRVNTWRLNTSLPAVAQQFGPWCCATAGTAGDGSLLLAPKLSDDRYVAAAPPNGYITVIGTEDNTELQATLTTRALRDPTITVAPDGENRIYTRFGAFDQLHVQLQGTNDPDADDLSGSVIDASAPVVVFAGHLEAYVPTDAFTSDHLEAQLPPLDAWGQSYVIPAPPWRSPDLDAPDVRERAYLTLVAGPDGAHITPSAPLDFLADAGPYVAEGVADCRDLVAEGAIALGPLETCAFGTRQDLALDADAPVLITRTLTGSRTTADPTSDRSGDPSFEVLQALTHHTSEAAFALPPDFTEHILTVITPDDNTLILDGQPLDLTDAQNLILNNITWRVLRVTLDGNRPHRITSADGVPFGATLHGFAPQGSYAMPAALNLTR